MTIRTEPIANGAKDPAVATAMPTVSTRKNVPMNSTPSLRAMVITSIFETAGEVMVTPGLASAPVPRDSGDRAVGQPGQALASARRDAS